MYWQHARAAVVRVVLVVLGCTTGACVGIRPEPARDAALPCEGGQFSVCLGHCVTPRTRLQTCTQDECDPNAQVCGPGLRCTKINDGAGPNNFCLPSPGALCDPDIEAGRAGNNCGPDMFCARIGTTAQVQAHVACVDRVQAGGAIVFPSSVRGFCFPNRVDNETCDGDRRDWANAQGVEGTAVCSPCASALSCWNGRCRRPCEATTTMDAGVQDGSGTDAGAVPSLGICPTDRPGAGDGSYGYSCSPQVRVFQSPNGGTQTEGRLLCTHCGVNQGLCPPTAPQGGLFYPVVASDSGGVLGEQYTVRFGPRPLTESLSGGLCCDPSDGCVNERCCRAPGTRCSRNAECCALPLLGRLCCADPSAANSPLCTGNQGTCVTCGRPGGVPCPQLAGCTSHDQCGNGTNCPVEPSFPCDLGNCTSSQCLNCGRLNDPCCQPRTGRSVEFCRTFSRCDDTHHCRPCGQVDTNGDPGACCPEGNGPVCRGGGCIGGRCRSCGGLGLACCPGGQCQSGLGCNGQTCVELPCASQNGNACCPGNQCAPGHLCVAGICRCGTRDTPCCLPNSTCGSNLACVAGTCRCGASGQVCCDQRQCDQGLGCGASGVCECGAVGTPCCAGSSCNPDLALCQNGQCVPR